MSEDSLRDNNITSEGANVIFSFLLDNKVATRIYLSGNMIDDNAMDTLSKVLKCNSTLNGIWLGDLQAERGNLITDKGIEILSKSFDGNSTLRTLCFSFNKTISNSSISYLKEILNKTKICVMNIRGTSITNRSSLLVPLALNKIQSGFNEIGLYASAVKDEDIKAISQAIKKSGEKITKIKYVTFVPYSTLILTFLPSLGNNLITSFGFCLLFKSLVNHPIITCLDLSGNRIDDSSMDMLGEFLSTTQTLNYLSIGSEYNFSFYEITDHGVEVGLRSLIGNISLTDLCIGGHLRITNKSSIFFYDLVSKSGIKKFYLEGTSVSEEVKQEIDDLLQVPVEERDIPVVSSSKSAAKSIATT